MPRLTHLAHEKLAAHLRRGDLAIDATAGNGHDTCLLAQCVTPKGSVLAIDRQQRAIDATRERLLGGDTAWQHTTLVCGNHADLLVLAPENWRGQVQAIVFNLGYLPGSDKSVVTNPDSTRQALDASLTLLAPGGLLSILIYRGHAGGPTEEAMVIEWLLIHGEKFYPPEWNNGDHPTSDSPRLVMVIKR